MKFVKTIVNNLIATITIDRPDHLNAMNLEVLSELKTAFSNCINDDNVGIIILTGKGEKAFVAGADIKAMQQMNKAEALSFGKTGQDLTQIIEYSPKPVIAAINGFALGGGCEISLACHIRIAAENSVFAQPEVHLGLIPGWGGTQRLTKLVGKGKSAEIILSGNMINAQEALRIGLVNNVVPLEDLLQTTEKLAKAILNNGPNAIASSLDCIHKALDLPLEDGLSLEVESFSTLFGTDETNEGLTAFIEKRKPKFR